MAEQKTKFKLSRRLLIWVLPATIIPTVAYLLLTKGSDLGQSEADAKAAKEQQASRQQAISQRVNNPQEAAREEAKQALERAREGLPPPPTEADVESKSRQARQADLARSREIVSQTLNDGERQSTGLADSARDGEERKNRFVVYSAPSKEGIISGATSGVVNAVAPPPKPFLSANNDKVTVAESAVAKRFDGQYWLAPGTIIRAVLLGAIDTKIPGQVTARVTEPVYDSRYGRYLVVPTGSTLNGQYDSAIQNGQHRVMMSFSTLVTPSGGVVELGGMRAGDALGRLGIEGELHTNFLRRMSIATLLAIESVALDRLSNSQTTISSQGATFTTTNTSEAARIISDAAKQDPALKPVAPYMTIDEGQKISIITMASIEIPPAANRR